SARIILIEGGPNLLAAYTEEMSQFAKKTLERLGVNVWTGSVVTNVTEGQVHLGTETIDAGTILWAAGVSASPLGRSLGAQVDRAGRVLVSDDLSVPEHPEISVVGDLAALKRPNGTWLPGVAQVAIQQGKHAARNVRRKLTGQTTQPFAYRDF